MKEKGATFFIKILVTVTFLIMITVNLLANVLPINGQNTAQVSDSYPNLFAPIGFTFAIWGLIYVLLAVYTIYQLGLVGNDNLNKNLLDKVGVCFSISSIANTAWIFSWHYNLIPVSMVLMLVILSCLTLIAQVINKEKLSKKDEIFIRLPFGVYFGWITIATIANAVVLLVSAGWNWFGLTETVFTVIIIFAGAAIGISVLYKYRDISYGAVLLWAYSGIFVKHISSSGFQGRYTAVIIAVAICICILVIDEAVVFKKKLGKVL